MTLVRDGDDDDDDAEIGSTGAAGDEACAGECGSEWNCSSVPDEGLNPVLLVVLL